MPNINVLDDKTINQIAAGEVVERPVSVVKELVENAIDAGATNISVEIKDGGISMIRVTDNGFGIDKNNIRTAFLRHATSKIINIEDLFTIKSLGFRGEALSSIAAVSQIELLTKVKDEVFGLRYCLSGGREDSLDEVGIPDGTTIIVRNLFFNTPARRKFLKSPMTEGNYISELMERLILSHPEIGFKYIINGKERMVSTGKNDIKQDIYSIYGRDIANLVVPISYESENVIIEGYIGKPEVARGNRNFELLFVNKRCIKSSIISRAIEEAYKSYLMVHKYPFVVIYITVPTQDIDVNVHPAKTEIKFYKEDEIVRALTTSVSDALTRKELIKEITVEQPKPAAAKDMNYDVAKTTHITETKAAEAEVKPVVHAPEPFETKRIEEFKATVETKDKNLELLSDFNEKEIENVKQEELDLNRFLSKESVKKHKIIGQVFDTYWIVELDDKMYIIDQHAAHEKVLYERYKKQIDSEKVYSQGLSPAIIVTLTNSELEVLEKYMSNFARLGFAIEHFGGREYAITEVPTELFGLTIQDYFHAILDDLKNTNRVSDTEAINDRIATMACKAAIKGNMRFSFQEASALIDELLTLENPYNCPHGRPTIISYSKYEIEKLFKRIV